jgi:hypothetical protein
MSLSNPKPKISNYLAWFSLLGLSVLGSPAWADFEGVLADLQKPGEAYVQPVTGAISRGFNNGWVPYTPSDSTPFISLSWVASSAFTWNSPRYAQGSSEYYLNSEQIDQALDQIPEFAAYSPQDQDYLRAELKSRWMNKPLKVEFATPTMIGNPSDPAYLEWQAATETLQMPDGSTQTFEIPTRRTALDIPAPLEDWSAVPMLLPQLTFALPYSTQIALRYMPLVGVSQKLGSLSMRGLGISHNLSQWIPKDYQFYQFTATSAWMQFEFGQNIESQSWLLDGTFSRKLGWKSWNIEPLAGLSYESSSIDMSYWVNEYDPVSGQVVMEDGKAKQSKFMLRPSNQEWFWHMGLGMQLWFVHLRAEYQAADQPSASLSLSTGY